MSPPLHYPAAWRRILGAVLSACLLASGLGGETSTSREYEVKAVFLLNFALFTQWPPEAFTAPTSPLVIGILGEDPFGGAIDEAVAGETVAMRPIVVRRYDNVEEAASCHVLFVSQSERGALGRILGRFRDRPVLTVSDIPEFARRGGVIGFYLEGRRLRFEISRAEVQRHGLQLSSQVLNQARIVSEGGVN